jgi:predicted phage tail protein
MLYGSLGATYGKVHHYDVVSPAQAIKALSVTIKGFKQSLIDGGYYRILVGGKDELDIDQLGNPMSDRETIRIVPVVAGANGLGKIILGGALLIFAPQLGVAFGATAATATTAGVAGFAGITASTFASIGVSLVIGGVSQMLFSPQTQSISAEREENKPSFIFNGAVNTTRQGNCVPICYGRMIVGSQVISAGLSVTEL